MAWKTSYHHYDAQGSTRQLTDSTETVTDTYNYDAFGNELSHTGSTKNPFRWNGRWGYHQDGDTGTYQVRQRPYSPVIARWLSTDRIGFLGGDANLTRYVYNSPVRLVDPSGFVVPREANGLKGDGTAELEFSVAKKCCKIELYIKTEKIGEMNGNFPPGIYKIRFDQDNLLTSKRVTKGGSPPLVVLKGSRLQLKTDNDGRAFIGLRLTPKAKAFTNIIAARFPAGDGLVLVPAMTSGHIRYKELIYTNILQIGRTEVSVAAESYGSVMLDHRNVPPEISGGDFDAVVRVSIVDPGAPAVIVSKAKNIMANRDTINFDLNIKKNWWFANVNVKFKWIMMVGGTAPLPTTLFGGLNYSVKVP